MIIATENLHIGDLISRRVPFVVPKYQRPYAWEEEEVNDFIRDLKELYELRIEDPLHPQAHFFGGIVSVDRIAPNTFTGRVHDVIDGQQRLATVMLTVSLLVKGLEQLANQATNAGDPHTAQTAVSHADTIKESYLEYKEVVSSRTQMRIRLRLSRIDEVFFEALIKNGSGSVQPAQAVQRVSQERLLKAWTLLNQQLIQPILDNPALNLTEKLDHFLALRSSITEDCYIIHIVSDNVSEAFRLFAILNDRGKSLSEADLLRVHTLELLEGYDWEQDQVEQCWDEMLGIKETELAQFLRAYYPSHKGERAPSGDFADHFKKQFFNYKLPLQVDQIAELQTGIARMRGESRVFLDIANGQWPFETPKVSVWERDRLSYLIKVLKHTLCIPLLLSAYQGLPEAEFSRLISVLERFVFRYITMVGAHAGRLGEVYYRYARGFRQNQAGFDVISLQGELATLQRSNAPDSFFEEAMKQKLVYSSSMRPGLRYFLTTVEYYLPWYNRGANGQPSPETTRMFDVNQVSIEHIYPQKPATSDPLLEPLKHDIGNLTFWGPSDNSSATNAPFATKKALYGSSMVRLNQALATLPTWDTNALLIT
ncbi:MAG TPA: DUF262 domain-containing HNH endonuclease family protein [Ktedonobacteraceae bacterium]|nr:DUF262 domain-containing HNH endonuclease family protein [Ktedonobacteraceae bacterium]